MTKEWDLLATICVFEFATGYKEMSTMHQTYQYANNLAFKYVWTIIRIIQIYYMQTDLCNENQFLSLKARVTDLLPSTLRQHWQEFFQIIVQVDSEYTEQGITYLQQNKLPPNVSITMSYQHHFRQLMGYYFKSMDDPLGPVYLNAITRMRIVQQFDPEEDFHIKVVIPEALLPEPGFLPDWGASDEETGGTERQEDERMEEEEEQDNEQIDWTQAYWKENGRQYTWTRANALDPPDTRQTIPWGSPQIEEAYRGLLNSDEIDAALQYQRSMYHVRFTTARQQYEQTREDARGAEYRGQLCAILPTEEESIRQMFPDQYYDRKKTHQEVGAHTPM